MSTYKVKKGDGWHRISKATGVPLDQLLKLNGATTNTMLHPDQVLKIKEEAPKPQPTKTSSTNSTNFGFGMGGTDYAMSALGSMYLNNSKQKNTEEPVKEESNEPGFFSKAYDAVTGFVSNLGSTFGGQESAVQQLAQHKKAQVDAEPKPSYNGTAIYLNYPNFEGSAKNALKIGNFDVGGATGIESLPVGHAAAILIGDDGNAYHYEYGRYAGNSSGVIGKERRASVKGGNFKRTALAKKNPDETAEQYIQRIYSSLPNAKYGTLQATIIPEVDTKAADAYWQRQADDPNRQEYNIAHTCAGEACNLVSDFVSPGTQFQNFFEDLNGPSLIDAVNKPEGVSWASHLWGLIPGTTGSKNRDIQERSGTTTLTLGNKK